MSFYFLCCRLSAQGGGAERVKGGGEAGRERGPKNGRGKEKKRKRKKNMRNTNGLGGKVFG